MAVPAATMQFVRIQSVQKIRIAVTTRGMASVQTWLRSYVRVVCRRSSIAVKAFVAKPSKETAANAMRTVWPTAIVALTPVPSVEPVQKS